MFVQEQKSKLSFLLILYKTFLVKGPEYDFPQKRKDYAELVFHEHAQICQCMIL